MGKVRHVVVAKQVHPARITQGLPQPQGGAAGVLGRIAGVVKIITRKNNRGTVGTDRGDQRFRPLGAVVHIRDHEGWQRQIGRRGR